MPGWSEEVFFNTMSKEGFTENACSVVRAIMNWAIEKKGVTFYWSVPKIPIFNAEVGSNKFISISAKNGWDLDIPFRSHSKKPLFKRTSTSQEVISRLRQMKVQTAKSVPLSIEHRYAIRFDSVKPNLDKFLALLDWIVDEINKEQRLKFR